MRYIDHDWPSYMFMAYGLKLILWHREQVSVFQWLFDSLEERAIKLKLGTDHRQCGLIPQALGYASSFVRMCPISLEPRSKQAIHDILVAQSRETHTFVYSTRKHFPLPWTQMGISQPASSRMALLPITAPAREWPYRQFPGHWIRRRRPAEWPPKIP